MPVLLRKIDKIFPTLCLLWAEIEVAKMRNLNMLNRYRLTKKELELYGCNGDHGNGFF